jgi:hypothetical protein
VTILGVWVCFAHVYALAEYSFPVDEAAALLAIATALVSVAACFLAQVGAPLGAGRAEAEDAERR